FVTYYSSPDNIILEGCQGVLIINYTKATVQDSLVQTTVSLLYDVPIDKEMEHCNAVYREDVIVSSDDDNNVNDYINAPVDNNVIRPDENVGEDKHSHAVDKNSFVSRDDVMAPNMDYTVPGGGDMPADKVVSISNENVSDSKNGDANASCKAYKNVSSGDKNRICRLFIKLPSLVRAALISRPFWFGLVSILVWITCRDSKKRSSRNLRTR
ncbi:TIR-NBS-LRR RCT1 resistance protein, partial [Trifolium medium]|nr:TIR-NBS-LRR RCT1 resistance protein [Trifolium medium]